MDTTEIVASSLLPRFSRLLSGLYLSFGSTYITPRDQWVYLERRKRGAETLALCAMMITLIFIHVPNYLHRGSSCCHDNNWGPVFLSHRLPARAFLYDARPLDGRAVSINEQSSSKTRGFLAVCARQVR